MKKILTAALLLVASLAHPQASVWTMPGQPTGEVQAEILSTGAVAFVWDGSAAFEDAGWSHRSYSVAGADAIRLNDITTHLGTTYAVGAAVVGGYPRPLALRLTDSFHADSSVSPLAGGFSGTGELTAAGGGNFWGTRNYQGFPDTATVQRAFSLDAPPQWSALTQLSQKVYTRNTSIKHAEFSYAVGSFPGDFAFMWMNDLETDSLRIQGFVGSLEDVAPDLTMCGSATADGTMDCGIVIEPEQLGGTYTTYSLFPHAIAFHSGSSGYYVGSYDGRPAVVDPDGYLWAMDEPGRCLRVRTSGGLITIASVIGGSTLRVDRGFPSECWSTVGLPQAVTVEFGPAFTMGLPSTNGTAYARSYATTPTVAEAAGGQACSTNIVPEQSHRGSSPISELLSVDGKLVARGPNPPSEGLYIVRRADGSARLEYLRTNW